MKDRDISKEEYPFYKGCYCKLSQIHKDGLGYIGILFLILEKGSQARNIKKGFNQQLDKYQSRRKLQLASE